MKIPNNSNPHGSDGNSKEPKWPPGWEAMRSAFPPEIRDPFEASYPIAFPGDPVNYKDDIIWNLFQVLRMQTAMQYHVNNLTDRQVRAVLDLYTAIKDANLASNLERSAVDRASLQLLQAAEVIRSAETTRKEYEVLRQEVATPWYSLFLCMVVYGFVLLGMQYVVIGMGLSYAVHELIHKGEPDSSSIMFLDPKSKDSKQREAP